MKTFPLTLVLLFVLRLRFLPGSSVRRILISRNGQTALNSLYIYINIPTDKFRISAGFGQSMDHDPVVLCCISFSFLK